MIEFLFLGPAVIVWAMEAQFGRFLSRFGLTRPNYRGLAIPTSYGLLLLLAAIPFYLISLYLPRSGALTLRVLTAALAFALLGFADDKWGDRSVGGLKGHFRKLWKEREITTGAMKAFLGAWVSLVLALMLLPRHPLETLVSAGVIALTANSLNLVDTRPARALVLYFAGMAAVMILFAFQPEGIPPSVWPLLGAAAAYLPVERARRGMLGDSGANLLGGVLGFFLAAGLPFPAEIPLLAALVAFHLFTERRSLNGYIREEPLLRRMDEWIQGKEPEDPIL